MRLKSTFTSSKLRVCQILMKMLQFVFKAKFSSTINLRNVDAKTITDWNMRLRNVRTRTRLKFCTKFGGQNEVAQVDEEHFFRVPKCYRGKCRKLRD